jgi:hypothetical protein
MLPGSKSASQQQRQSSPRAMSRREFIGSMVAMAMVGWQERAQAALVPVKPFSFAVISDAHLTTGVADTYMLFNESQLFLQDAVKTINSLNLDFVLFLGDMIETPGKDEANWNLFIDIMQTLNCRWDFVLGESDAPSSSTTEKMRLFGPDWKGKDIDTNVPYWSYNFANNVHLIGLDSSRPNSKGGAISDEQLKWLKDDIESHKSQFTIVFSHHPLLAPSPYDSAPLINDHDITNGAEVREILASSPYVRLALSGHVPINAVQKEGSIYYVSCPSLIAYPCAFKVFRVGNDDIKMETHYISYKALTKKAEKAMLESSLAHHYSKKKPRDFLEMCAGSKEENNALLPLYGGMTPQAMQPGKPGQPPKANESEKKRRKKKGEK